ncbi:MAG: Fic family protein [Sphingobacteriaceae bacterium]|nr:Fic family protein [Sphingobacteriaceae bacterium]
MELFYFDLSHAIKEHDFIIEQSGGKHGYKDLGLLESVVTHVRNDEYYPLIEDKVSFLCFSINKNHCFIDGNKRSSIVLSSYFLSLNGLDYCIDRFVREMENIAVYVAANFIDSDLLREIITSIIYEYDFSEELKLKITSALSNQLPDLYNVGDEGGEL